jgi:hypothetical protein
MGGAAAVAADRRGLAAVDLVLALVLSWLVVFSALGAAMAVRGGVAARRLHSVVAAASTQAEAQAYLNRCPSSTGVQAGDQTVGLCYSETQTSRTTSAGPLDVRAKALASGGTPYSLVASAAACQRGANRRTVLLYWGSSGGAVARTQMGVNWLQQTTRRLQTVQWQRDSGTVLLWSGSAAPGQVVSFSQPVQAVGAVFQLEFNLAFATGSQVDFAFSVQAPPREAVQVGCRVQF